METQRVLVTGATGYVGGRLIPLLLRKGHRVRCMVREPRSLIGRFEANELFEGQLEVVRGDVLQAETLSSALDDIDAAYYLIHAMGGGEKGFEDRDRVGAANFAGAAGTAGVKRIIYLGGLGHRDDSVSSHLHSRHEVGDILRQGKPAVTELRAAVIVGSGSASFEMLRHLTEKLPIMVTPKWVNNRTQPIFIVDALAYLVAALDKQEAAGRVLDIGGPDILTYRQMMESYAAARGLKRWIITVPVLTPRLSAYWVNLVTPIPASIAAPLIEGLRSETIIENDEAQTLLPVRLTPFREAVERAIRDTNEYRIPTRWSGSVRGAIPLTLDEAIAHGGKLLNDRQVVVTMASSEMLCRAFSRIGGRVGWYYADFLWEIRGAMDRVIGGVGVRRGRRHPEQVSIGDAIDFWRVEDYTATRLLLRAEMKVPGRAWLEFKIRECGDGKRELLQTAYYFPDGLLGQIYWAVLVPFHAFVFAGMAGNLVRWAEKQNRIEAEVSESNRRVLNTTE